MRLRQIAPAIASIALIGSAMTGGVAVASTPKATGTTATSASPSAAECVYVEAAESVKIRKTKAVNGTALGLLPKGSKACSTGSTSEGGSYDLCGHKSKTWKPISYRGIRGWIPYYCTRGL
ncbi:hypothetical protein [Streptomyces sp. NPDC059009]|uniref:hypothetical protein n=1 Tax=Streptomyces sp. NPDC059009 TaxID=3346694 RepID=UPI0036B47C4F